MANIRVRASVRYRNDALLRAREATGRSQAEAAAFCGVPPGVYMDLEKMDFSEATTERRAQTILRHAETVATAFGLTMDEVAPADLVSARVPSKDFQATATLSTTALLLAGARFAERSALPAGMEAERHEADAAMKSALSRLTPKQRLAVEARFGLDGGGERTFDDVAKMLRVSSGRARLLVIEAVRRMQHPSIARRLEEFI